MKADEISAERASVVAAARSWVGTPFHHASRLKGVGVDCGQLVIAVYTETGLRPEPVVEPYPADWFLHQDRDRYLEIVEQLFVPTSQPLLGDLLLFKYGRSASHGAIVTRLTPTPAAVHSRRGVGVIEQETGSSSGISKRLASCWTLTRWME